MKMKIVTMHLPICADGSRHHLTGQKSTPHEEREGRRSICSAPTSTNDTPIAIARQRRHRMPLRGNDESAPVPASSEREKRKVSNIDKNRKNGN